MARPYDNSESELRRVLRGIVAAVRRASRLASGRPVAPSVVEASGALRVFVCDDSADVRFLLRMTLEEEDDIEVVGEAGDGVGIVDAIRASSPDVVLMDLQMPRVGGLAAIEALRSQFPGLSIVVVSSFARDGMAWQSLQRGADRYVEKGAPLDELPGVVRAVVEARQPIGRAVSP